MTPVDRLVRAQLELAHILTPGPDRLNRWQRYEQALADRLHDGYPSSVGTGYTTDVANPTLHAVIARQRLTDQWHEAVALSAELQAGAAHLAQILATFTEPQPATRCTGGATAAWADVTCEANAILTDPELGPLCDRCRQRRDYWRGKNQQGVA